MTVRDTSIVTYHDIIDEGLVGEKQAEVFKWITEHPNLTDTEIAIGLGYSDMNKTRPRRKELFDLKLIIDNGKKVCSYTKRLCYQWKIADILPKREDIVAKKTVKVECPMCKGTGVIEKAQTSLEGYC